MCPCLAEGQGFVFLSGCAHWPGPWQLGTVGAAARRDCEENVAGNRRGAERRGNAELRREVFPSPFGKALTFCNVLSQTHLASV